ncbi:MAG: oxygen-dependent coproporphyrinogen oxidase [Simkaniaceae bacterium]|nr:oxygen-dependent coproporphyrinogen oxidase [Simkaniaceae bacterium]
MTILLEKEIETFLLTLREEIIASFEALDDSAKFTRKNWEHHTGGGGEIAQLRGDVFEKAAVNFSAVSGPNFPMQDSSGPFFATGISLITHMKNPHMPTVHMNIRYIQTEKSHWFGGGYDLTPMGFPNSNDTTHFHETARAALGTTLYKTFSKAAAEYFYIPHRKKERGVGGIFFDHYNTGNIDADLNMWKAVGNSFLPAIMPIYEKRLNTPYAETDRKTQLKLRAHYAEFNLMYDRGTKFGFQSGGNPEAILCSMPPLASW